MDRNTYPGDAGNPAWRLGRRVAVWLLLAAAAAATATGIVTRPLAVHPASAASPTGPGALASPGPSPTGPGALASPGFAATGEAPGLAARLDHSVVERTGTSDAQDSTGASVAAYGQ